MRDAIVRESSDWTTLFDLEDWRIASEVALASFLEILAFSGEMKSQAILSSCSLTSKVF